MTAAEAILRCEVMAGTGQKVREVLAKRSAGAPSHVLDGAAAPFDLAERMCQELDSNMKAQYQPMLRKAMEGGLLGAAASWWLTPQAKALTSAADEASALGLLRRDAMQCHPRSLMTFRVTALRFPEAVDVNDVAAVRAAIAQLVEERKMKGFGGMQEFVGMAESASALRLGVDQDIAKARTAEILSTCQLQAAPQARRVGGN